MQSSSPVPVKSFNDSKDLVPVSFFRFSHHVAMNVSDFVELRSRSGEGQVRVMKVKVRLGPAQRTQNSKILT